MMRITHTKTITILIAGAVFTAGLIIGFGGYVFAGDPVPGLDITIEQNPGGRVSTKNYKSSFSNTKSIGQVRMEVGNILLGYGFGGEYINQVTEALEGSGVYEAELKSFLLAVGMNEKDTQDILLQFDKLGISKDSAQVISAPGAGGTSPSAAEGTIKSILPSKRAEPAPATTDTAGDASRSATGCKNDDQCSVGMVCFKGVCIPAPPIKARGDPLKGLNISCAEKPNKCKKTIADFLTNSMEDLKVVQSNREHEEIRKELRDSRKILQENTQTLRQNLRENAQELRDNFRENVKTTIGHVDHGKTVRIAVAHGKGLRMLNRYRSAMARFDHILGRMESRVQKLEAQGVDMSAVIPLVEEAKNMSVENEAKLEELKAKYESLLLGKNPGGTAEEARAIAKELKLEIEKLHAKLRKIGDDVKQAAKDYNSSISNSSKRIAFIQSTIEKIQKRLKNCGNTDVCDIVDRHAKGRAEVTNTAKKAIENGNREDATRLLREVRGIVVGDIELLEGVENIESIAGVLELERSLLNYIDSALVSI